MTTPRTLPIPLLTEAAWLRQVTDLANLRGWKTYHTHNSMHSAAGFPDLVMVRPPRIVFAELKTDRKTSKTTPEQDVWLGLLSECCTDRSRTGPLNVCLWRPSDFDDVREVLW